MHTQKLLTLTSLALLLATLPAGVYAETKTYCDDGCNLKYCTMTCCFITTDESGHLTNASCNSTSCCAHPQTNTGARQIEIPPNEVKGRSGFVRFGLLTVKGLNPSDIFVNVDDGSKTVTLSGNVKSERQRQEAAAAAKAYAKGYRVKSILKIERQPNPAPDEASQPKP